MLKKDLEILLDKYTEGRCSESEIELLEQWFINIGKLRDGHQPNEEQVTSIFDKISQHALPSRTYHWKKYIAIAASIFLFIGLGLMIHKLDFFQKPTEDLTFDIAAASDKAILTLHNGEQIILDTLTSASIFDQYQVEIIAGEQGEIIYKNNTGHPNRKHNEAALNRIATPKGGKYKIQLADGSKVWLNANSSITFPSYFETSEPRKVYVSGEAYLEVATIIYQQKNGKSARQAFLVETNAQTIEVLGTAFNVKSYTDESKQYTTLVEGSVKVRNNFKNALLVPGEQAQIGADIKIVEADVEKEIAWKNGDFIFKRETLEDICKQISRWYDIEIDYPMEIKTMPFSGMIRRSQPLSVIMRMIESAGKVKTNLKERRLTISKI